jgi:hypothetical protein
MLRIRETSQIAVVTGSKQNKLSNRNNVRSEASRHFKNKRKEFLKDKINELAMNSKNKDIRDLYSGKNEFERGYRILRTIRRTFFFKKLPPKSRCVLYS